MDNGDMRADTNNELNISCLFREFSDNLLGLAVSHIWRGAGSAIFIEFGNLHARVRRDGVIKLRMDGSDFSYGDFTLRIEFSWRIESKRSILCGSWSDEARWPRALRLLKHATVTEVKLFGHLPEIEIQFSNGVRLLSFMSSDGDPQWRLSDRRQSPGRWLCVRRGKLLLQEESA